MRWIAIAALILLAVAVLIYAVVDVIITDNRRIRVLPKPVWVLITLFLPIIGAVLWFSIGKVRNTPLSPDPLVQQAPDNDAYFLKQVEAELQSDDRLKQLEEELKRLEEETDFDDPDKSGK